MTAEKNEILEYLQAGVEEERQGQGQGQGRRDGRHTAAAVLSSSCRWGVWQQQLLGATLPHLI